MRMDTNPWFDRIYEETQETVHRACRCYMRTYPRLGLEESDFVQKTYLRLYECREKVAEYKNITGWLVRVLRRMIDDEAKHQRVVRRHHAADIDGTEGFFSAYGQNGNPVEAELFSDAKEKLEAIEKILGKERMEILRLYLVEKVPLQELANRYETNPEAMKMRLSRWRAKCRNAFIVLIFVFCVTFRPFGPYKG